MAKALQIVGLHDGSADTAAVEAALRRSGARSDCRWVADPGEFVRELRRRAGQNALPDVIILLGRPPGRSVKYAVSRALVYATDCPVLGVSTPQSGPIDYVADGASAELAWDDLGDLGPLTAELAEAGKRRRAEAEPFGAMAIGPDTFRLLMRNAFDGVNVCEYDPVVSSRKLIFCNDRFVEMSGYTRDELEQAANLDEFVNIVERSASDLDFFDSLAQGVPVRGVASWKRPDGKENYYEYVGISWRRGRKFYIMGIDHEVTDQRRTEAALRASEARFRGVLSSVQDVIFEEDAETGRILYVSPSVETVFGSKPEEFATLGTQQILERIHPDDREQTAAYRRTAAAGSAGPGVEFRFSHKDGQYVWMHMRLERVEHADRPPTLVGVMRDISARKQAEESLSHSGIRPLELLRAWEKQVFVKDGDLRLVYANEAYAAARRMRLQDVIGKTDLDLFARENAERYRAEDRAVFEHDGPQTANYMDASPIGEGLYLKQSIKVPIKDAQGNPVALVGMVSWPEQERLATEVVTHWASLVAASDDAIIGLGLDGTILSWNPGARGIYGYSADEVQGKPLVTLCPPDSRESFARAVAGAARGESIRALETVHLRRDGARIDVAVTLSPILGARGAVAAVSAVARDITDRKRAQEALRESEERFRTMAETVFDGVNICEWDPQARRKRLLFCNDRYVEMSGFSRAQLERSPDIHGLQESLEDQATPAENYERMYQGHPVNGTARWRRPDGRDNAFEWSAVAVKVGDKYHVFGVDRDITERLRTEEALKASEERFRRLVETSQDGINICRWDPDGGSRKLVFCNDPFVEMSGYTREQLEACGNLNELTLSFEEGPGVQAMLQRMRRGEPGRGRSSWMRPDGKENVHEWTGAILSVRGEYLLMGIDRDITALVQAERALRQSEERFRRLVESSSDGINICRWDVATGARKLIFCNDRFVEMSGYTREELEACQNLNDLTPSAEGWQQARETVGRMVQGQAGRGRSSWKRPDGRENVHEWTAVMLRVGDEYEIMGIDRDITERVEAERALKESEERFRQVAERASEGVSICRLDPDTFTRKLIFCNDRFVEMTGHSRDELMAAADIGVFVTTVETAGGPQEQVARLLADQPVRGVASWNRPDGVENVFEWSSVLIRRDGECHLMGIDRDVTERMRHERELQGYADRLKALNAELERSNRDHEEFTYTVSHDLQEPLRKIITFGQFLIEDCEAALPPVGREHLGRMTSAAQRMRELINHLLTLSRVGTRGAEIVPVDAAVVMEHVMETFSQKIEDMGAEVTVQDGLPHVMADAVQLGQVFQNLIGNALKFRAPDRPPRITITAEVEGRHAHFRVADNGIGIEERFLEKVFGLFQRLHPRDEYEGAGVGLALCNKIVRRHRGKIWAESKLGEGTTFHFTLPLARPG